MGLDQGITTAIVLIRSNKRLTNINPSSVLSDWRQADARRCMAPRSARLRNRLAAAGTATTAAERNNRATMVHGTEAAPDAFSRRAPYGQGDIAGVTAA
jgi:hypothetical protein